MSTMPIFENPCGAYSRYETTKNIPLERLQELCTAEEQGLLHIWPCKVGDKVKVRCDTWGNTWNYRTVDNGKYLVGEIIAIVKTRKQTLMKIQAVNNVSWKRERSRYPISAIGKTVFLVEEAEKKLEEGKGK